RSLSIVAAGLHRDGENRRPGPDPGGRPGASTDAPVSPGRRSARRLRVPLVAGIQVASRVGARPAAETGRPGSEASPRARTEGNAAVVRGAAGRLRAGGRSEGVRLGESRERSPFPDGVGCTGTAGMVPR